jgi:bacterial leucyl aminopeptidase
VTETYDPDRPFVEVKKAAAAFKPPSQQTTVNPIISSLVLKNMQNNLATLTAFNNRYYKSQTGADASNWIRTAIQSVSLPP